MSTSRRPAVTAGGFRSRVRATTVSFLPGPDWFYLAALLVPAALFDLTLSWLRVTTQYAAPTGLAALGQLRSDVLAHLGFALLWVVAFALLRSGWPRIVLLAVAQASVAAYLLFAVVAHSYYRKSGSILDAGGLRMTLQDPEATRNIAASETSSASVWLMVGRGRVRDPRAGRWCTGCATAGSHPAVGGCRGWACDPRAPLRGRRRRPAPSLAAGRGHRTRPGGGGGGPELHRGRCVRPQPCPRHRTRARVGSARVRACVGRAPGPVVGRARQRHPTDRRGHRGAAPQRRADHHGVAALRGHLARQPGSRHHPVPGRPGRAQPGRRERVHGRPAHLQGPDRVELRLRAAVGHQADRVGAGRPAVHLPAGSAARHGLPHRVLPVGGRGVRATSRSDPQPRLRRVLPGRGVPDGRFRSGQLLRLGGRHHARAQPGLAARPGRRAVPDDVPDRDRATTTTGCRTPSAWSTCPTTRS